MDVTVAGVDVGAARKGFHAVALNDGSYLDRITSCSAAEIAAWCRAQDARVVAIDAPCRWRLNGRMRECERALFAQKIFCYPTPNREDAERKTFYRWMLNGAALYELLEIHFPLFDGTPRSGRTCVETFPQAVGCALAGKILSAKEKKTNRADVLRAAGLDPARLPNIDYIDAGLCALAAQHLQRGTFRAYGAPGDGFIVVPAPKLSEAVKK